VVITSIRPRTFFAWTFLASWLIWIPLVASRWEIGPFAIPEGTSNIVRLFGVLMPAVVAIVLTARGEGRPGVGRLLGRLRIWRVGWRWWAAAVVVPSGLLIAIGLGWNLAGGAPPVEPVDDLTLALLVVNSVFLLIASLGEEIGWRGVAQPGLQRDATALRASLVLGILWAVWHVPFWLPVTVVIVPFALFIVTQWVLAALVARRPEPPR
jgi:membrane protease YdiL (CAAX protease family)